MVYIPALNEILRQGEGHEPQYPEAPEELKYLVLYPQDYQGWGKDVEGNIAIMVNERNAREVKRLAEAIIEDLE